MRSVVPMLLTFTACSDTGEPQTSDHTMGEFEAFLEATQMLVDGHNSAVEAASSLEESQGAEASYVATWALLGAEIETVLGEIEACDKDPAAESHLDATRAAVDDLDAEMGAHMAQHQACATLAECVATETGHSAIMGGGVDACLEQHEAMHDLVNCESDNDMGPMPM